MNELTRFAANAGPPAGDTMAKQNPERRVTVRICQRGGMPSAVVLKN
jgi:hypothetical protein